MRYKKTIDSLLDGTGVAINGTNDRDPQIINNDFYGKVGTKGSLGLGNSYVDHDRTCQDLRGMYSRLLASGLDQKVLDRFPLLKLTNKWSDFLAKTFNPQLLSRGRTVIDLHYNLPAEFFQLFLDPYNQYTCGYFKDTDDLNVAQRQKMELVANKLGLKKGNEGERKKLADLGSGRLGFGTYMAENYNCDVTGVSLSEAQNAYAREHTKGLPIEIINENYLNLIKSTNFGPGTYDYVTAIGSPEHAGTRNYRRLMENIHYVLKPGGKFLRHSITNHDDMWRNEAWMAENIFPEGVAGSHKQIVSAASNLLYMVSAETFGNYYDETLLRRDENLLKDEKVRQEALKLVPRFAADPERYKRIREYYFRPTQGAFHSGELQLTQMVFTKGAIPGGYNSEVDVSHTARD